MLQLYFSSNQLTKCLALWTLSIRIKIENQYIIIIYVSGSQIRLMRSSCGPDLSFETLKSKFDCLTTKNIFLIFVIFGDFGPKSRENIDFLPIYRNQQKTTIYSSYLILFRRFFIKELFEF